MIHIKRFIERVSMSESRQSKNFTMPITEARGLRDELAKMLVDLHIQDVQQAAIEPIISVEVRGGSFK